MICDTPMVSLNHCDVFPTGREFPSTLPTAFRMRPAAAFRSLRGFADCRDPGDVAFLGVDHDASWMIDLVNNDNIYLYLYLYVQYIYICIIFPIRCLF